MACKSSQIESNSLVGIYTQNDYGRNLELKSNGDYILHNAEINNHIAIEQCEYASKGKWKQLTNDIIEITSEDYYLKQEGFKCDLEKVNKLSQDTLYIEINMPQFISYNRLNDTVNFTFTFNNKNNSIKTNKTFIKLPKEKYLLFDDHEIFISFDIYTNLSFGIPFFTSRLEFPVFHDYIDTKKFNYLIFTLPYFDLCFFEFGSFNQELIYLKNKKNLFWKGDTWIKMK